MTFRNQGLGYEELFVGPVLSVFSVLQRCCEYKSSLKTSEKNKGSRTARLVVKRTVGLNTGMCIYSVFLFIRTTCNSVFIFCGRLTLQNPMKNIIEKNVPMQQIFFFFGQ